MSLMYCASSENDACHTVHDNKAKLVVIFKKRVESLCVKFVVAEIERCVDGLERLKVNIDLLFFAFVRHDGSTVHNKTVWWHCSQCVSWNITQPKEMTRTAGWLETVAHMSSSPLLYNLRRCCTDVMAPRTESLHDHQVVKARS